METIWQKTNIKSLLAFSFSSSRLSAAAALLSTRCPCWCPCHCPRPCPCWCPCWCPCPGPCPFPRRYHIHHIYHVHDVHSPRPLSRKLFTARIFTLTEPFLFTSGLKKRHPVPPWQTKMSSFWGELSCNLKIHKQRKLSKIRFTLNFLGRTQNTLSKKSKSVSKSFWAIALKELWPEVR